jgi:hypothetical protein
MHYALETIRNFRHRTSRVIELLGFP